MKHAPGVKLPCEAIQEGTNISAGIPNVRRFGNMGFVVQGWKRLIGALSARDFNGKGSSSEAVSQYLLFYLHTIYAAKPLLLKNISGVSRYDC